MKKDLIEYDITTAAIEEMKKKYSGMKITDAKSDKAVRAARTFMVSKRTAVEKKRIELNANANQWRRKVNDEADRITALLLPIEEPLQIEVKRADAVIEAKRAEKEAKERERIEAIQEKINSIRSQAIVSKNMASSHIEERLIIVKGMKISKETYLEFTEQAMKAHEEALIALEDILVERRMWEKEDAERKAEAERLEIQRKEQVEAQAKIDEEKREIEENRKKFEENGRKAKLKKEQEEFERQAKIKAEQEAKEKAEKEERERVEKEKAEAKEKARQEALRPDKDKLMAYADALTAIPLPKLQAKEANAIVVDAISEVGHIVKMIKEKANKL